MKPLHELTLSEAARALAEGSVRSVDLVGACLDRIAVRDPEIEAWAHLDPEAALEQAQACDASPRSSALQGVPVAIKDIIDTAGLRTEYGSKLFAGHQPARDAACVSLLRKAGCVILGKTVTTEFAMFQPGKTHNPYDLTRTPGGSSSGSAAAVADFQAPASLTTQTAGSTIKPAAFCGIVGFKPTFSSIPTQGVRPQAQSLDTVGVLCRSAQDLRLMWDALQGRPLRPNKVPPMRAPRPIRLGLCRTPYWDRAQESQQSILLDVAALLEQRGVELVEVSLPPSFADLDACHSDLMAYEASRNFVPEYFDSDRSLLGELTLRSLEDGWRVSTDRYMGARRLAALARSTFRGSISGLAGLLVPAAPGEAPSLATTGDSIFSKTWSLLGTPTISLPVTLGSGGLPLAVQLVGATDHDELLMAVACALQAILVDAYGSLRPDKQDD